MRIYSRHGCRYVVHGNYHRFGVGVKMNMLTLNEAAQRCDVSVVTLRRAIKAGTLRHAPRRSDREPYLLDENALEQAGFTVMPEIHPGWRVTPPQAPSSHVSDDSRILSDLEAVRAELASVREERDALLARVHRAEGELSATRRDFDTLSGALAPAMAALSERSSQSARISPTAEPLRGEVLAPRDTPRARRWWQRERGAEVAS